jgi:hypothetical protein
VVSREQTSRLDEFDKNEWRDVARRLKPDMTDAQFDEAWDEFQADKRRRQTN